MKHTVFHTERWNSWRKTHKKPLIAYKHHGTLLHGPRVWNRHWKGLGGVVRTRIFPRNHHRHHGYTKWAFQGGSIYVWTHGTPKIVHHTWRT